MHLDRKAVALGLSTALGTLLVVAAVVGAAAADDSPVTTTTTQEATVTKTVLLVGDSVPKSLANEFADAAAKHGYALVSAATGGCPASGVEKVFSSGKRWKNSCPRVVSEQDAKTQTYRPALVIWWSRYELAPRLGAGGKVLPLGSKAYFRAQATSFDERVRALTRLGARVVTVQIEPPGPALAARNPPERYFLVGRTWLHRSDVVKGWNAFLARHKGPTVYSISIDRLVCRAAGSPCDDRLPNGVTARPDGVHYSAAAQRVLAPQIFDEVWRVARLDS